MRTPASALLAGNRVWTEAEREELINLYLRDLRPSIEDIATELDRTPNAISTEANRVGLRVPGVQLRKCLPCDRPFFSSMIGHRICPRVEPYVAECA